MTLLAHISDPHVNDTPPAAERVRRVMDHLRSLPTPPDALLVTGDIADHGEPAEYRRAAALFDAPFPVLPCPGNHDVRRAFRTALLGEPTKTADGEPDEPPVNRAHRIAGLTILMCDSTIPGQNEGRLDESTQAWIRRTLASPDHAGPALLALHHPPVPVHHPYLDAMLLTNADDLAELLAEQPRIIGVVTGHAHTAAASAFAGRPVLVAPGVASTLVMPPRPDQHVDRDAPVGLAWHLVEHGQLTTHFRTIG